MVIDSHQHFWKYDPVEHAWIIDGMASIRRDFLPDDLRPILAANGIDGCVAVQASQTEKETAFLLELAQQHDFIKGVVGWVDLRSENIETRLEHFSQYPKLKGFRHIVQGEADHNFLLRPSFKRGISALAKHGFTYDILVFPHQLGAVLEFVRLFPRQKFVIDHLAKPYIKDGFMDGWVTLMRAIANYPNVFCKLSGMVTEADYKGWKYEHFVPYLDLALETFGPARLMYGSDWPVCLAAATYEEITEIIRRYTAYLSPAELAMIWGKNAGEFYALI